VSHPAMQGFDKTWTVLDELYNFRSPPRERVHPLLLLNDATFAEGTLELRPGDLLLTYTDGVTEVRATDPGLGERELRATLAAHAGAPAEDVVAAVERRAVELQDDAPRDDIALVAVRVLANR